MESKMLKVMVTEDMLLNARAKAFRQGEIKNSFTKGKGNTTGFLGEEVVKEWCKSRGIKIDEKSTKDYDLIINGYKCEIKTKGRSVPFIQGDWPASIAYTSTHQRPDLYIFCSMYKQEYGFVVGVIEAKEFFEQAAFIKKGEYDASNNWTSRWDHFSLAYNKLGNLSILTGETE